MLFNGYFSNLSLFGFEKSCWGEDFIGEFPTLCNGVLIGDPQAYLNDSTTLSPTTITSITARRGLNTFLQISSCNPHSSLKKIKVIFFLREEAVETWRS